MRKRKTIRIVIAACMLFLLSGCGRKLDLVNMKEYTSPDETYSIEADENCTVGDVGIENWLELDSSDELGSTIVVMQFPKAGVFQWDFTGMEDIRTFMEEYLKTLVDELSDRKETEKPENEQLSNIEAYIYETSYEGYTSEISVVLAETDYAYYVFMYEDSLVKRYAADYFNKVCASFKENAEVIEEKAASLTDISDTVRWFNASNAILIAVNDWDYQLYGGLEPDAWNQKIARQILDDSWGVTDKDSADEVLDWLLTEGHRMDFVYTMEILEEMGMSEIAPEDRADVLLENFETDEETVEWLVIWYNRYDENYEDAASGWDYNRALSQLANFYLAGYYTLEESLDASLEVAKMIQSGFDSWDDYMESYFTGYEFWAGESSEERRVVYEHLKNAADNPYSIDFNTKLEKSW